MHYPVTDIQDDFEINRPVRYQITAKIYYLHRQTGRWTDGLTDGRTDAQTYVAYNNNSLGSFFEKIILKMKDKCSYGHDLLSNIMFIKAHYPLIKPLTLLINQYLSTGVLPNDLKISRVKPLFKRGNA